MIEADGQYKNRTKYVVQHKNPEMGREYHDGMQFDIRSDAVDYVANRVCDSLKWRIIKRTTKVDVYDVIEPDQDHE